MHQVALNAHLLSLSGNYRSAGISWYIYNVLKNLGQAAPDLQLTAFLHEAQFQDDYISTNISRWPTQRPAVRIMWEQMAQPYLLSRNQPDLYHAMAFVAPMITPCPFVITVYDLTFLRYPEAFRPFNRWYLRYFTTYSVKRAQAIIAISESTRQDVINLIGKPPDQVHTIYCGADPSFRPLPSNEIETFRQSQQLPQAFVLYLGTLEPRKNVAGLIRAYATWYQQDPQAPLLVIAGGKGWYYQQIFELVETLGLVDKIYFPGYIPQADLALWYNAASLFVYPSYFEGFGLPVLEAMACGTPVITSNTSSLPEVAGQAAMLVDPKQPIALTVAMQQIMQSSEKRQLMRQAGVKQATQFRWEKTAQETVAIYRQVIVG